MAKKSRREIKEAFKTGSQPTGADFQNFMESVINCKDDGIEKQGTGLPIKIQAQGTGKNIFDFYDDETHAWRVNQNPSGKSGLNIEDSASKSRLFIQDGDGNVGISTTSPQAKLHVVQAGNQGDAMRVYDESNDATPFVITGGGSMGIGTGSPDPSAALHVAGKVKVDQSIQLENGAAVNEFSTDPNLGGDGVENNDAVPTERAVKTYVDKNLKKQTDHLTTELSFPKGGIIMWSGNSAPQGWTLCDGQNGTPDLRGRFVLGIGQGQNLTSRAYGDSGGEESHTLLEAEMPQHNHAVSLAEAGNHKHNFTAWRANFSHAGSATESCNDDDGDGTFNRETKFSGSHNHGVTQNNKGDNTAHDNMPPYFVLAYIMKL